jgi:hypothetical protein
MTMIKTRIRVAPDGTLSGRADGLPAGEHDAEITVLDAAGAGARLDVEGLLARIHAIQAEVARLPVLDNRTPEEIIGYNELGHFD